MLGSRVGTQSDVAISLAEDIGLSERLSSWVVGMGQ